MALNRTKSLGKRIDTLLWPSDEQEQLLRQELLHRATQSIYDITLFPFFGAVCVLVATHWVPVWKLMLWYIACQIPSLPTRPIQRRLLALPVKPAYHQALLRPVLAIELSAQLIWMLYVPLCWVDGDLTNNSFLLMLTLASLTSSALLYSPCLELVLPSVLVYIPFLIAYPLRTGGHMNLVLPATEALYIFLLIAIALHHHYITLSTARQRRMIQSMTVALAEARDAAILANQAKSAFLASMSHALRTPMNTVLGYSDLIRQQAFGPITPADYHSYITDIHASGQHLLCLIDDIFDLSKIETGRRELTDTTFSLTNMIRQVHQLAQPLSARRRTKMVLNITADFHLTADERAIRQIMINFLSNAIKFTPADHTVTLFARRNAQAGLDLGVLDQGIGMDEAGIQKALEPYGQVRPSSGNAEISPVQGTGLGLPIAKALIEAHGASLHIRSYPGRGTEIWGAFPPARVAENS